MNYLAMERLGLASALAARKALAAQAKAYFSMARTAAACSTPASGEAAAGTSVMYSAPAAR